MSKDTLLLWIIRTIAQYVLIDPCMTTKMIEIHLVVITNLFFVVTMRVATKDDHVVSDDSGRVESPLAWNICIAEWRSWVLDFRPMSFVQLKSVHPIRELRKASETCNYATVDDQGIC